MAHVHLRWMPILIAVSSLFWPWVRSKLKQNGGWHSSRIRSDQDGATMISTTQGSIISYMTQTVKGPLFPAHVILLLIFWRVDHRVTIPPQHWGLCSSASGILWWSIMDEQLNHQDIKSHQDSITIEDALRPIDVLHGQGLAGRS